MIGDDAGWPWDMGAIGLLDGADLVDGEGRFRIEAVRRVIEPRLSLVPHARHCCTGRGRAWAGRCGWTRRPLTLLITCVPPRCPPRLARRSSWRRASSCAGAPWTGPGRCGRCGSCPAWTAGGSGYSCGCTTPWPTGWREWPSSARCSTRPPGHPRPPAPPWTPSPVPSARELLGDNARRRARELGRALSGLAGPAGCCGRRGAPGPPAREAAGPRAPRVSLNGGRIGLDRRLALVRGDLGQAAAIARAHGGTVNDVVLAAVAGGCATCCWPAARPCRTCCCAPRSRSPCTRSSPARRAAIRSGGWPCRCRSASPALRAGSS